MLRRDAGSAASVAALARSALAQGQAALAANDRVAALQWLERAHRLVPQDLNVKLSLASALVDRDAARAAGLFAAVLELYDVRQAWVGLAAAHLRMSGPTEAAAALANALARHALMADIVGLADQIASGSGHSGWCGLTSDGAVRVHPANMAVDIRLDGTLVPGAHLAPQWAKARQVDVLISGRPALGSPIRIDAIRRVAGCVEAFRGGIRGWAWHPGDPDVPVTLTLVYPGRRRSQAVTAVTETTEVETIGPLARPRAFSLSRNELLWPEGPVFIQSDDGRNLLGSPLDPAAETAGLRDAALLLGQRYPARPAMQVGAAGRSSGRLGGVTGAARGGRPVPAALRADGPVPAEAVGSDSRRRGATVVIPVHDGAAVAIPCLHSVLASITAETRVIVVDDGSSDPALTGMLDDMARRRKIRLLRHPRPLGFPASANAGIIAAADRDVVLLNSDTLVPIGIAAGAVSVVRSAAPAGWVARLRDAAYRAADIGTVTPFSNDASVVSYPGDAGSNPRPDQAATNRLDRLAHQANGSDVVDIPVGVGFCLYLRRDCLNVVGLLRADVFAQGYGEENDLCLRARHLGWRSVALTGLFVGHHAGSSLGPRASPLRARNARILEQLHPGYDALIARFIANDPLADARRRIDLLQWRARGRRWQQAVILISHNDGGGVEQRVALAAASLADAGRRPIVLRPAARTGGVSAIAVQDGVAGDLPNLVYDLPTELPAVLRLLRAARPECVQVHHFLDHPQTAIHDLVTQLGVPYDVHIHDYAWCCPRIALVGVDNRYCGEPELFHCEACIADLGHFLNEEITVAALRRRSAAFLAGARTVVAPSDDARMRIMRHFPAVRPMTVGHEDDASIPPASSSDIMHLEVGRRLRVCIVGGIGVHKGYDVVLACGRDAATRNLALEFVVVGNTIDDERLLATGRVFVTGGFRPEEAVELIVAQGARLGFIPSIWPETWCLSLGDIWRAGLAAAAFDIGAPAERIRRTGRGFLLPLGLSASAINNALVAAAATIGHVSRGHADTLLSQNYRIARTQPRRIS